MHAHRGARNKGNAETRAHQTQDGEKLAGFLHDSRSEAGAPTNGQNVAVKRLGERSRIEDKWTVAQAGEATPKGNDAGSGRNEAFAEERKIHKLRIGDRHANHADINGAVEQPADLRRRGHVLHLQFDMRTGATKLNDGSRENFRNRGDAETDAKSSRAAFGCFSRGLESGLGVLKQLAGKRNQHPGGFGQSYLAAGSGKQRAAHFLLEFADVLAESRLRHK